jgi:cell wall assembly regulator SMI1
MAITLRSNAPLDESELKRAEAALGSSIPEGYRTFLRATDGGSPVEDMYTPRVGVDEFLGAWEIVDQRVHLRGRIPETLLPIAVAAGGNHVCISVADGEVGTIYFWDHELEHLGPKNAVERIAESFDEFVSELRAVSRENLPPHRVISVEIDPEFLELVREQEEQDKKRPTLRWPPERNA